MFCERNETVQNRARTAKDVVEFSLPRGNLHERELQSALASGITVQIIQIMADGSSQEAEAIDVESISSDELILDDVAPIDELILELEVGDLEDV